MRTPRHAEQYRADALASNGSRQSSQRCSRTAFRWSGVLARHLRVASKWHSRHHELRPSRLFALTRNAARGFASEHFVHTFSSLTTGATDTRTRARSAGRLPIARNQFARARGGVLCRARVHATLPPSLSVSSVAGSAEHFDVADGAGGVAKVVACEVGRGSALVALGSLGDGLGYEPLPERRAVLGLACGSVAGSVCLAAGAARVGVDVAAAAGAGAEPDHWQGVLTGC